MMNMNPMMMNMFKQGGQNKQKNQQRGNEIAMQKLNGVVLKHKLEPTYEFEELEDGKGFKCTITVDISSAVEKKEGEGSDLDNIITQVGQGKSKKNSKIWAVKKLVRRGVIQKLGKGLKAFKRGTKRRNSAQAPRNMMEMFMQMQGGNGNWGNQNQNKRRKKNNNKKKRKPRKKETPEEYAARQVLRKEKLDQELDDYWKTGEDNEE